jgi:hypothetical protein
VQAGTATGTPKAGDGRVEMIRSLDELIPARVRGRVDLVINGSFWLGKRVVPAAPLPPGGSLTGCRLGRRRASQGSVCPCRIGQQTGSNLRC